MDLTTADTTATDIQHFAFKIDMHQDLVYRYDDEYLCSCPNVKAATTQVTCSVLTVSSQSNTLVLLDLPLKNQSYVMFKVHNNR